MMMKGQDPTTEQPIHSRFTETHRTTYATTTTTNQIMRATTVFNLPVLLALAAWAAAAPNPAYNADHPGVAAEVGLSLFSFSL